MTPDQGDCYREGGGNCGGNGVRGVSCGDGGVATTATGEAETAAKESVEGKTPWGMRVKGLIGCPLCNSGHCGEAKLLAHLMSGHFMAKLAFTILGQESHFACPKIDFSFRHVTQEGVGNHLGRGHRGVVIALVRQILPGFCFSNCNIGNAFKEGNED